MKIMIEVIAVFKPSSIDQEKKNQINWSLPFVIQEFIILIDPTTSYAMHMLAPKSQILLGNVL